MKVIGYTRVSTVEQARDGLSLETQVHKIRVYCDLHDLELGRIIADPGESARSLDRPGAAEVFAALDQGAEGVVVSKLDRLTRSLKDWAYLIDRYFGDKVKNPRKLLSVSDSIDTRTATGRMVLNLMMTIYQWEREIIGERTADALATKHMNGERCGRWVRYGRRLDPSREIHKESGLPVYLIEDPAQQEVINRIVAMRGEGLSTRSIARYLEELGIETATGKRTWSHTMIARVLARASARASANP